VREREYGLTISKRASRDAIGCLVALAMAVEWAASIEPPKKSVYDRGGWSSHEPVVGQDRRERGARAAG
jgi:hypothetical protein